MSAKHTPGPWKFTALGRIVADSAGQVVCRPAAYANNAERQVANARLIAAAPELLDELIEQDKFLGVLAGTVPLSEKDTHRRIAMHRESVRAAITKATSRE